YALESMDGDALSVRLDSPARLALALDPALDPDRASGDSAWSFVEGVRLSCSGMRLSSGAGAVELSPVVLALRPVEAGPMLIVGCEELAGELELCLEEPLELRAPGRGAASIDDLRLGLSLAGERATVEL